MKSFFWWLAACIGLLVLGLGAVWFFHADNEYMPLNQTLTECSVEGSEVQVQNQWLSPIVSNAVEATELQIPLSQIGNHNPCPSGYEVADVCAYINLFNTQVANHRGYMARLNYHENLIEVDTANPQFTKDFFGLRSGLIGETGHFGQQTIGAYVAPSDDGNQFIITSSNPISNHIEISPVFLPKLLAKSTISAAPIRCVTD